jgi:isopenicillin N synthase-like dioxygenase
MSDGAVPVVDVSQHPNTVSLAEAIKHSLQTVGFLFLVNHGMEEQVEEMFRISGAFTAVLIVAKASYAAFSSHRTLFPRRNGAGEDPMRLCAFIVSSGNSKSR